MKNLIGLAAIVVVIVSVQTDAWSGYGVPMNVLSSRQWPSSSRQWLGRAIERRFGGFDWTAALQRQSDTGRGHPGWTSVGLSPQVLVKKAVRHMRRPLEGVSAALQFAASVGPAYETLVRPTELTRKEMNECAPKRFDGGFLGSFDIFILVRVL